MGRDGSGGRGGVWRGAANMPEGVVGDGEDLCCHSEPTPTSTDGSGCLPGWIELCLSACLSVFVCLSVCLSVCICLSLYVCLHNDYNLVTDDLD